MRSLLSFAGLLLACVGIGLFLAIAIYVWTLKADVNQQTSMLVAKANEAGDGADKAINFVRDIIGQAENDLENARKNSPAAQPARPVSLMDQIIARKASQELAGSVERAHGAVVTASDAVKVANAALEVFSGNTELKDLFGVQPEQLNITRSTLNKASTDLRQVKTVLGMPVGTGDPLTNDQLNAVDSALGQARGFTNEMEKVVANARGRVNEAKVSVDRWSWRIAIATTAISILAAVGQVFMARYCWRTLRGLPA
jgi:hypothetical protein